MNWLEVSVVVDCEAAEAVAEVLSRYVPNGVAIEQRARDPSTVLPAPFGRGLRRAGPSTGSGHAAESGPDWSPDGPLEPTVCVRAYLPIDAHIDSNRQRVAEALWHLHQIYPVPEPAFREVSPSDWENAWKEHYHVVRIGSRFVIKPSWRPYEPQPGDAIIELDPGLAFGTGLHPTTQMCLHAIERYMPAGAHVIDLGSGSGILAIAAAKLGAASVLALDVDPVAVEVARENVRRNRVDRMVRVEVGSLDLARKRLQTFDFALVNILATVIIRLCDEGLAEMIRLGGLMITAGLIDAQESEVCEALGRVGFTVLDRVQDKDWVGLVCRRATSTTD